MMSYIIFYYINTCMPNLSLSLYIYIYICLYTHTNTYYIILYYNILYHIILHYIMLSSRRRLKRNWMPGVEASSSEFLFL